MHLRRVSVGGGNADELKLVEELMRDKEIKAGKKIVHFRNFIGKGTEKWNTS